MAHLAVEIGAVAYLERDGSIEFREHPDGTGQNAQELLAFVTHPARELVQAARPDPRLERQDVFLRKVGRQHFVVVSIGRMRLALAATGDAAAAKGRALATLVEQLDDVELDPTRDLLEHVIGRRHLAVLDLRQGRAGDPCALAHLFQGPTLLDPYALQPLT